MECLICKSTKAPSYYSPKELTRLNIYICSRCLPLLKFKDLRYVQNNNDVMRLVKRKEVNK